MAIDTLKIIVCDGGAGTTCSAGDKDNTSEKDGNEQGEKKSLLYKTLNYNQTIRNKIKQSVSPTAFFAIQQGINLAVQTGRELINYYIGDIGRSNGDSNFQAIVNRRIEKVTDALSVGQGMLAGAAAGATAGPVGAVVGALIGVTSSSINLGFKYAARERSYQHEIFEQNNSQAYQMARANYSALTGRLR